MSLPAPPEIWSAPGLRLSSSLPAPLRPGHYHDLRLRVVPCTSGDVIDALVALDAAVAFVGADVVFAEVAVSDVVAATSEKQSAPWLPSMSSLPSPATMMSSP